MKIVGVDLSLTATGVAIINDDDGYGIEVVTVKSTATDNSLEARFRRLEGIAAAVVGHCKDADMVVMEGPSYGSKGGSQWDRAGLWWWVISILQTIGTPVREVPPTVLKKWATGNGSASKSAVVASVTRLWPDITVKDDNQSDALCLATMGAQHLGMRVPKRAHHSDIVDKTFKN